MMITPQHTDEVAETSEEMEQMFRLPQFDVPDNMDATRDFEMSMRRRRYQGEESESEAEAEQELPDLHPLPFKTSNDHVYFKFNIFFKEALVHMLFPLSLPFVLWFEGFTYAKNRYFWPKTFKNKKYNGNYAFYRETSFNLTIAVMLLYWAIYPDELDRLTKYEISITIIMAYVRYIVIATKYAYLSVDYYESLSKTVITAFEGRNGLLIPWFDPPTELLIAHWKQRVTCKHIKLDGSVTFFPEQLESVKQSFVLAENVTNGLVFSKTTNSYKVLDHQGNLDVSGNLQQSLINNEEREELVPVSLAHLELGIHEDTNKFSAAYLSWQIILDSVTEVHATNPFKVGTFIGIVHIMIPYLVNAFFGLPFFNQESVFGIIVSALAMFLTLTMFVTNMTFMQVGAMDLWRRHFYQLQLDCLISRGYHPGTFSLSTAERLIMADRSPIEGYVLDMTNPYNITVWMETRELLRTFGIGFYKRICAITAYYALFGSIEVLVLLVSVYGTDIKTVDPSFWAVTAAVFWDAVVISIGVVAMVYPAALTNAMGKRHREHLLRHKLRIENYLSMYSNDLTEDRRMELEECCRLLYTCQQKVEIDDDLNPIRILGVRANPSMYRTLSTIVLSAISAIGRLLGFV